MHRLPGRRECAGKPATRQFPLKRDSAGLPAHAEPRLQPRVTGRGRSSLVVCTFVFLVARALPAQAIGQGFELERAGQYDQAARSEEHTSELQSHSDLVCRLLLEKKKRSVIATSRPSHAVRTPLDSSNTEAVRPALVWT